MESARKVLRSVRRLLRGSNSTRSKGPVRPPRYSWSTWAWIALANAAGRSKPPSYREVSPGESLYRNPPGTLDGQIHWRFANRLLWNSPPLFLAVLPGGRLWGDDGAVVTPDGDLLVDLSTWTGIDPKKHAFFRVDPGEPVEHSGELISLAAPRGDSFFHWMFDVLPRIKILRRSGYTPAPDARFVVNPLSFSYQHESLDRLGVAPDRLIEPSRGGYIRAERLVVPSFPGNSGEIPGWVCEFLRSTFLDPQDRSGSRAQAGSRLYIGRGEVRRRRVVNESQVLELLEPHGFRFVDPSRMTLGEVAHLFASAGVVVAPHGGALTNLVFCRPGTRVVEIFSPGYVNVCYWSVADAIDLDYMYLLGQCEGSAATTAVEPFALPLPGTELHPPGCDRDITVDLDRLDRAVRRVCSA